LGHAQPEQLRVSAGEGGNVVGDLALLVPAVALVGLVHQGVDPLPARQRTGGYPLGNFDGVDVHTYPHPLSAIAGGQEPEDPAPGLTLPSGGVLGSGTAGCFGPAWIDPAGIGDRHRQIDGHMAGARPYAKLQPYDRRFHGSVDAWGAGSVDRRVRGSGAQCSGVASAGTCSSGRGGGGGVPSPKGCPPSSSRWCGVSQLDRSGPLGTIWLGFTSLCTT